MKNVSTHTVPTPTLSPGASILIVDDSVDSRSFCELMADMFNLKVEQARNVDEAIAILGKGFRPSILLLDLIMPGRQPEDLVEIVKANPELRHTKVVIMSALREVGKRAREMGADAAMRKPFTMPRFVNVLGLASLATKIA